MVWMKDTNARKVWQTFRSLSTTAKSAVQSVSSLFQLSLHFDQGHNNEGDRSWHCHCGCHGCWFLKGDKGYGKCKQLKYFLLQPSENHSFMNRHMICKPLCKSSENQHFKRSPCNQRPPKPPMLFFNRFQASCAFRWRFLKCSLDFPLLGALESRPPIAFRDGQLTDFFAKARHHSQHRNLDCCIVAKCNSPSLGHFETLFGSTHLGQNWQQTSNETEHGVCQRLSVHMNWFLFGAKCSVVLSFQKLAVFDSLSHQHCIWKTDEQKKHIEGAIYWPILEIADTIAIRIPSEWPFFLLNPWEFKISFQQVTSLLWFFGQDGDIMPWCRMPIWIVIPLLTAASIENLVTKLETTKFKKSASIDCVHLRTMYP